LIRAQMQQTPTRHVYYQTTDSRTGRDIITNEEYLPLGASVTTAITGWRRGADRSIMELVEEKALTVGPNSKGEIDYTFRWSSPRAEEWEDQWVRKYNGEYGYEYVGRLTEVRGVRRLEVYSYKVDATTATHQQFARDLGGDTFTAAFPSSGEGADDTVKRPALETHLRTLTIAEGPLTHSEVISRFYKAKKQVEGSDRMFGILEDTMHFIQTPALRRRIEIEVAGPVADWVVGRIIAGSSDDEIQNRIRDRYINEVKALVGKLKMEQQQSQSDFAGWAQRYEEGLDGNGFDMAAAYMLDLKRRQEGGGAFCGEWKINTKSFKEALADLSNYTGLTGAARFGAGGFSKTCVKCGIRAPEEGGCGWCSSCEHGA
jgi:hypothetical protein